MKSKNRTYVAVLLVMLIGFTFFFSTKFWLPDDRTKENNNYDEVINVGEWMLKVTDAKYDPETKTLQCSVYQKTMSANTMPYKIAVYNQDSNSGDSLKYLLVAQQNNPNLCLLEIKNVPAGYYYLTVMITTSDNSNTTSTAVLDEFGQPQKSSESSVSTVEKKKVMIDYRTVQKIKNSTGKLSKSTNSSGTEAKKKA